MRGSIEDVADTISVRRSPGGSRYEILDAGAVVGAAHYIDLDDRDPAERIFYHTIVDEDREGEGLASRLAGVALDDTVRAGLVIVGVCPFISAYLRRHPTYRAHSAAVRPEHLEKALQALNPLGDLPGAPTKHQRST